MCDDSELARRAVACLPPSSPSLPKWSVSGRSSSCSRFSRARSFMGNIVRVERGRAFPLGEERSGARGRARVFRFLGRSGPAGQLHRRPVAGGAAGRVRRGRGAVPRRPPPVCLLLYSLVSVDVVPAERGVRRSFVRPSCSVPLGKFTVKSSCIWTQFQENRRPAASDARSDRDRDTGHRRTPFRCRHRRPSHDRSSNE